MTLHALPVPPPLSDDPIVRLRDLIVTHLLPTSPLAQALTDVAISLEAQRRGLAAAVERIEALEQEVQPWAS